MENNSLLLQLQNIECIQLSLEYNLWWQRFGEIGEFWARLASSTLHCHYLNCFYNDLSVKSQEWQWNLSVKNEEEMVLYMEWCSELCKIQTGPNTVTISVMYYLRNFYVKFMWKTCKLYVKNVCTLYIKNPLHDIYITEYVKFM